MDKVREKAEARLTALAEGGERSVVKYHYDRKPSGGSGDDGLEAEFGGLAAHNGLLFMSLRRQNQVLVVDARTTTAKRAAQGSLRQAARQACRRRSARAGVRPSGATPHPSAGKKLLRARRLPAAERFQDLPPPETLIADGLEDPQQLTLGAGGLMFISDWGKAHQVKVYAANGSPVRTIGKPGGPQVGAYDPEQDASPQRLDHR